MAAQLTAMKGFSARGPLAWMKRASTSLPVPVSPVTSTETEAWLARRAWLKSDSISGLEPVTKSLPARRWAVRRWVSSRRMATTSCARKMDCSSRASWMGFCKKSCAPFFIASTAMSMSP